MTPRRIPAMLLCGAFLLAACSQSPLAGNQQATTWTPQAQPTSIALASPTSGVMNPIARPTAEPLPTPAPRATYTVERGEVIDELTLSGRVSPVQLPLAFSQDGVLERLLVAQGDRVEAGQLLAELDLGDLAGQLEQARVSYNQDQVAIERDRQAAALMVERAKIDLKEAEAALAKAKQVASPADIAAARAAVQQAKSNLSTVRNEYSATKTTAEQDLKMASLLLEEAQATYASAHHEANRPGAADNAELQQALTDARVAMLQAEDQVARAKIAYDTAYGNEIAAVQQAEAEVAVAEAELTALLEGPDPFTISQAEREVQRAAVSLREAEQQALPDPEMVKRLAAGEAEINSIQAEIEGQRLFAPFAGEVVVVEASPGFPVRAGSPLIMLMDSSRMEVVASALGGRDTGRLGTAQISVGQPVEIIFSRYSDQTITGTITRVPNSATGGQVSATGIHIGYNAGEMALELGDLADVKLTLGRKLNALWLPLDAVTLGDNPFVTVKQDDEERRVNVQVGLVSVDRVEILSGLSEGEVVIVR